VGGERRTEGCAPGPETRFWCGALVAESVAVFGQRPVSAPRFTLSGFQTPFGTIWASQGCGDEQMSPGAREPTHAPKFRKRTYVRPSLPAHARNESSSMRYKVVHHANEDLSAGGRHLNGMFRYLRTMAIGACRRV